MPALKKSTALIYLTPDQESLMKKLMRDKLETNKSAFFASLLVVARDCYENHGIRKAGRPKTTPSDVLEEQANGEATIES